jgi:hypothetical protein
MRPTFCPTAQGQISDVLSDSVQVSNNMLDMSAKIQTLVSDITNLQDQLERLEAYLQPRPPRVQQRQTDSRTGSPTPAEPPRARRRPGEYKLTPEQAAALRAKRASGVPIKALMAEFGLSRASVFRSLK